MPDFTPLLFLGAAAYIIVSRYFEEQAPVIYAAVAAGWAAYLLYCVFVYPFYVSPLRHLPQPKKSRFPWAHAEAIRKETNGAPFREWINSVANEGLIRFRVLFNQERLLLTSPAALKEVLVSKSSDFEKPSQPNFLFRQLLGNGVLVAEGHEHKRQRKALMPAFSFRHIKDLYPVFWSKAQQVTTEMAAATKKAAESSPDQSPIQKAYNWANRVTLDIIGLAAMGHDFKAVTDPDTDIVQIYKLLFEIEPPHFRWTVIGILAPLKLIFGLPLPVFKNARTAADSIRALGYDGLKKKRERWEKGGADDVDILSVAMRSGEFTDDQLVDQMMTFLAAGHETTASALTWATYLLCSHPEVQTRLREEIRKNLPSIKDADSTVSAALIDKLPYLNAVCNEVLRFIPSVPMTIRDARVDTVIQGQHVPKGTRMFISPWATNTSVELWGDDALKFNPERWLQPGMANAGGAQSNLANLSFLHGPRSCIGKDFAKGEFLCLLAAWIGRFEVSWGGDPLPMDVTGWVTVKPAHELPVVFKEIEGW